MTSDRATTAEAIPLPAAPTLRGALRTAISDFYFNSWRLVPANLVWGLSLGLLYLVALVFWPAALLLAPLLAFPTLGIFRIATLIVRGESVSFWDGIRACRHYFVPTLAAGVLIEVAGLVFIVNLVSGITGGDLIGLAFATMAGWGLIVGWLMLLCYWPLLTDPRREGYGLRGAFRSAGYLVVAHPVRLGALGLLLGLFFLVSAVAFAALVSVSIAYGALVACRYVLPAADRLEARLAAAGKHLAPARSVAETTQTLNESRPGGLSAG